MPRRVISISVLTLGIISLRKPKDERFPLVDFIFSITLVLWYLIAPLSHDHHLTYLLPALFVFINYLQEQSRYNWQFWLAIIAAAMMAYQFNYSNPLWLEGFLMLMISFKFYAVLILWGLFLWVFYKNTEPRSILRKA